MLALVAAALLQSPTTAPASPSEAELLGRRLAAQGPLATMLPIVVEKDLAELAAERPDLTAEEKRQLAELGRARAGEVVGSLNAEMGRAYAGRLSVADLRVLVAQNDRPETARWRAAQPAVIAQVMAGLGAVDLKKDTAAAFCARTGKLCDRR